MRGITRASLQKKKTNLPSSAPSSGMSRKPPVKPEKKYQTPYLPQNTELIPFLNDFNGPGDALFENSAKMRAIGNV